MNTRGQQQLWPPQTTELLHCCACIAGLSPSLPEAPRWHQKQDKNEEGDSNVQQRLVGSWVCGYFTFQPLHFSSSVPLSWLLSLIKYLTDVSDGTGDLSRASPCLRPMTTCIVGEREPPNHCMSGFTLCSSILTGNTTESLGG